MSVLAVICARGGSKGLPRKNVLDLGGKPLIAWTVEAAKQARLVDRVILSCDDAEIIAAAKNAGCEVPFIRPSVLATDTASIYEVLFHALDTLGHSYKHVALLQATSPLRASEDIDACIERCQESKAKSVISVVPTLKPPQWMYRIDASGRLVPALEREAETARRQDAPEYYLPNGAVYVAEIGWLRTSKSFIGADTVAYRMPPERSVDIDSYLDLIYARAILEETQKGVFA